MPGLLKITGALLLAIAAFSSPSVATAQELSNDVRVTAEITRSGQLDSYFFDASAGDIVYLTVADRDSTNFSPSVRIFDPNAVLIVSDTDLTTVEVDGLVIAQSGRYSVLVQDSGADFTGIYTLNFVRVSGANEFGELPNDARIADTLALGDLDTFTFNALAGDKIHLNLADSMTTNFSPDLRLHDPSGALAISDADLVTATIRDFEILTSGTWTVVISDSGADFAGEYELFFANVRGANEKGLLPNDTNKTESLALGDIDTWTFTAAAGDTVYLNVADILQTNFSPDVLVYGPDSVLLDDDADLITAHINRLQITNSGLHTVVVKDSGADFPGDYTLYFSRVPNAAEFGVLVSGEPRAASLLLGDIDTFEFNALSGANVQVNVSDANGTNFSPTFVIHDPSGVVVASDADLTTASASFVTAADGFYSVVVQDSNADIAGAYTLDFFYIGAQPPPATRSVVLEPRVWHLLGVPGDLSESIEELFGQVLIPGSYNNAQASEPWVVFFYEPNPNAGPPRVYRTGELSETIPAGKGFWLQHFSSTAVRVNLPIGTGDAQGVPGGGCASSEQCITVPLAQEADTVAWTIVSAPTLQSPVVDDVRFVTNGAAPACTSGCTLPEAFDANYTLDGFWRYDSSEGAYQFLSGMQPIEPWVGLWSPTTAASSIALPRLLLPVQ